MPYEKEIDDPGTRPGPGLSIRGRGHCGREGAALGRRYGGRSSLHVPGPKGYHPGHRLRGRNDRSHREKTGTQTGFRAEWLGQPDPRPPAKALRRHAGRAGNHTGTQTGSQFLYPLLRHVPAAGRQAGQQDDRKPRRLPRQSRRNPEASLLAAGSGRVWGYRGPHLRGRDQRLQ